ncbi:hypothetical protein HPP92_005676 [Vanilla planifolia]|uniref:AB hydrolase-1 domain-containing protein n=1 Tax=Vanilla planifolia TaxID=51239 RepID=A0A835RZ64_VANPL|nr:hypothetical protein HPP92_005676 [Vanilla planifolia]
MISALPPPPCLSSTAYRDWCYSRSFFSAGLRSSNVDLDDGRTTVHCWVPRSPDPDSRPSVLLIHGFGANATWQWDAYVRPLLSAGFDLYIPDLLFFGGSYTVRSERDESFQAECIMAAMKALKIRRLKAVVGVSYGGFVGFRIAALFPAAVERVVLICAGVCLEEKDLKEGMFVVDNPAEAANILLPQTPEMLRRLIPNPDNMGEQDQVFPLELGHRLSRLLEKSQLVVIKNAGHAVNLEKSKELCKHLEAFVIDTSKEEEHSKCKVNGLEKGDSLEMLA